MAFYIGNMRVTSDDFFKELRNKLKQLYDYDAYLEYDTVTDLYIFRILDKNHDPVCTLTHYDTANDVFRTSDAINRIKEIRQMTNFDKITKDSETLRDFIETVTRCCSDENCDECPLKTMTSGCTRDSIYEWLKEVPNDKS